MQSCYNHAAPRTPPTFNYAPWPLTAWSGYFVVLATGNWAPFPAANCSFFDASPASRCTMYRWSTTATALRPTTMCCSCGGGSQVAPPPPQTPMAPLPPRSPPAPPPPCMDGVRTDYNGFLLNRYAPGGWASVGWQDCTWMTENASDTARRCSTYAWLSIKPGEIEPNDTRIGYASGLICSTPLLK